MIEYTHPSQIKAAATHELARLEEQTEQARAMLSCLQRDVTTAEDYIGSSHALQLLEANEQLIISTLRAQSDADIATLALKELSQSAELDALTALPNRVLLLDRLTHAIANAKRHGTRFALLFLDLDNFKQINDTLGHAVGDQALKWTAHCLASAVREADTVSRHGGDEFLILIDEVSQVSDACLVADKIIAALDMPHCIGDHVVRLTASIGISIYPDDGDNADSLIHHADSAMYVAKWRGVGSIVYGNSAVEAEMSQEPQTSASRTIGGEHTLAEHKRRYARLQEKNEQLVRTALSSSAELRSAVEQAQRQQIEFLAALTIELRESLASLRTATTLLSLAHLDETLLPRLQVVIEQQVEHLGRLVDERFQTLRVDAD